jgi:raffinose/stachyose/melibiose transport system permease protein
MNALRKKMPRIVQYFILSIFVLIVIVPIVMIFFGALKTRGEFMTRPYTIPIPPNWENIDKIIHQSSFLAHAGQ